MYKMFILAVVGEAQLHLHLDNIATYAIYVRIL